MKTFSERVVDAALDIPAGSVSTYGDIARACGAGGQAARSISSILGRAYNAGQKDIPFHRIVYSKGRVWSSGPHVEARMKLYKKEGIEVDEQGYIYDFDTIKHQF